MTPFSWTPREPPLDPAAVAGKDAAAIALARAVLRLPDDEILQLSGVSTRDRVVLSGPPSLLPWAEDALYLGRDPSAPALLLPTTLIPSIPVDLLQAAILMRGMQGPVVILPDEQALLSLSGARPLDRQWVEDWLKSRP